VRESFEGLDWMQRL